MRKLLVAAVLSACLPMLADAGQWYVFGEGGYSSLTAGSHNDVIPVTISQSITGLPGLEAKTLTNMSENFDSVTKGSAGNFGGGFGYEFPFGNRQGILASNDVELLASHVTAVASAGIRSEYELSQQSIINGQSQGILPVNILQQQEAYSYQTSNTRLLINYTLNFKPFIAHLASFVEVGVGTNLASFSKYSEQDLVNPTGGTGLDKVNFANNTKINFAYNAGLGLSYQFTSHWAARLGYRYTNGGMDQSGTLSTPDIGIAAAAGNHISNHVASNEVYLRGLYYI